MQAVRWCYTAKLKWDCFDCELCMQEAFYITLPSIILISPSYNFNHKYFSLSKLPHWKTNYKKYQAYLILAP